MSEPNTAEARLPDWAKKISVRMQDVFVRHDMNGPVCHVGSLINREDATNHDAVFWRKNFSGLEDSSVVGIDIFPGVNVDVVADLCDTSFPERHSDLIGKFGIMFCSALLEHVQNPFPTAANLEAMLRPGGHLYFGGPWVWGYHPYPDDYWRISFAGLKILFPRLDWKEWWYSGTNAKTGISIEDPKLERKLFGQRSISGPATIISDRGMPYLNVGAIGRKPA